MKTEKENKPLKQTPVICNACGAENSIRWEKKEISINDKHGSYLDLTFDFCKSVAMLQMLICHSIVY